jgi:hypothetical protein
MAPAFKEQELSNLLWALGRLGFTGAPAAVAALAGQARAKLHAFAPQVGAGVAVCVWACACVYGRVRAC